jgi:hypothetical protein
MMSLARLLASGQVTGSSGAKTTTATDSKLLDESPS